ncbi:ATP-dependent zinc metalloprotease FtsH [Serpentinicella sp. ANB-PHB4]|uniref:ATP-dependent zinc metalloprotease FtsH n=1 Tax=Serpentinicella sp. ANB-PHB4 TaxID=3074076 RepID=UPI00285EA701|nr:ATP-dependent zinc metalloprotease FtsH [Serpentinicella sp. ANB-PHB4]MDR5659584.1 ATP-dependent zinc metalloprotease FtsH [Serpentinicella sp. ANB-PHB4]
MKKRIIFILMCVIVGITILSSYSNWYNDNTTSLFSTGNRIFLIILSSLFVLYYYRMNKNPQYAHAPIQQFEKKEKDQNSNEFFTKPKTTFEDVAGLEEVKEELSEVIDFINQPDKYRSMGAKIPKGILFHGPPGTGKTLLASAVAGETKSSFFSVSGSEFVEKYVGVGAKRIRTLFEKAKKEGPSVIFIDEMDAIGAKRSLDSNNEKDQTLNQLLVELDGFNTEQTVVVVGATNRMDMLDEALLRPGRFDRHMFIGNPNVRAREDILKVHTNNKPLSKDVNIAQLARKTHGMSGAHLANVANEAAIIAVRQDKKTITSEHFDAAIERVVAGLQVKNSTILLREKKIVAFHEAGHALVAKLLGTDMVQKVSIVPRGQALGYVIHMPQDDRYIMTKDELCNKIMVMLGGKAAEDLIFKHISTGAKDDLKKVTEMAMQMVCEYGMSELGYMYNSPEMIKCLGFKITKEVNKIVDHCYQECYKYLQNNQSNLTKVAEALLEKETLSAEELDKLLDIPKDNEELEAV